MKRKLSSRLFLLCLLSVVSFCMIACGTKENKNVKKDSTSEQTETKNSNDTSSEVSSDKELKQTGKDSRVSIPKVIQVGIKNTIKSVSVGDFYVETDRITPYLEDKESYPALNDTFSKYEKENKKKMADIFKELKVTANSEDSKDIDDSMRTLYARESAKVMRADTDIVSIYVEYHYYNGGVHEYYDYSGINIDTKTGQTLSIQDIVSDADAFYNLVKKRLKSQYRDIYAALASTDDVLKEYKTKEAANVCWTVNQEGIMIYFNPEVLGSYADGAQKIFVRFDELPSAFNPYYVVSAKKYVMPYNFGDVLLLSIGDTGTAQPFRVIKKSKKDDYLKYTVKIGKKKIVINSFSYSAECYIVQTGQKYYLYLEESSDNDYRYIEVVDLQTMNYNQDDNIGLSLGKTTYKDIDNGNTYIGITNVLSFVDPDRFYATGRLELLSTTSGTKLCKVTSKGRIKGIDAWYEMQSAIVLKTKKKLMCDIVNISGKIVKSGNVAKGKYLRFVRSDGKKWVDFQLVDAKDVENSGLDDAHYYYMNEVKKLDDTEPIYRVYVKSKEYPRMINGKSEDSIFDGLAYAG